MSEHIELPDDSTRPVAPELNDVSDDQRLPGKHLQMIHDHHRHNMQVLRQVIEAAENGEISATDMQDKVNTLPFLHNYRRFGSLCGQYCQIIHAHHSIEDTYMLPALSAKASAYKQVVDRLMAEHEVVHELLIRLIGALNVLIEAPEPANFQTARTIYEALEKLLNSHFRYEEKSVGDALGYYGVGL